MGYILDSARQIIGESDRTKFRIPKLPVDVEDFRAQCKAARMMLLAGDDFAYENFKILCEARAQAVALAQEAREDRWDAFVVRMEGMNMQEVGKVTRSFKMARQGGRGARLASDDAALERIALHFEGTFRVVEGSRKVERLPPWMDESLGEIFGKIVGYELAGILYCAVKFIATCSCCLESPICPFYLFLMIIGCFAI